MTKKRQFDKLALWLSIISILFAAGSLFMAVSAYVQTDRPHTLFQESCAKLDLLDKKIDQAESYIQGWREEGTTSGVDLAVCEQNLAQARTLREDAVSSLMTHRYGEANERIQEAYELALSVPVYPTPPAALQAWVWGASMLGSMLVLGLITLILFAIRRRRTPESPA